jgi:pimeloyl-ACP methyl ester carboxylesterase
MRYLYLHGFASGAQSRKAQAFKSALAERQLELEIPAVDSGDFEHLTITGQLQVIEKTLRGAPVRLIGSSMGGYLAALYASRHPEVDRLVLLAPAFSFSERWGDLLTPAQLADWRATGSLSVYHYGDKTMRRVHYGLFEDALRYAAAPDFAQPALIFHGVHDNVVPIELSRGFASNHANARLVELDADHELLAPLPRIAAEGCQFISGRTI